MKRHLSDSEPEICDDYEECSSPDTMQISRKKRRGIIEKRRRDRINNCLVELRRLVPAAFEKQGSAKLEKAEILQMTVDHLRHLHSRDPRGFNDPYSPYGNTRAFLDYSVMGFRECASEIAHFISSVEGAAAATASADSALGKEPLKMRIMGHLENMLSQKELAINAAMAANSQVSANPKGGPPPLQTPISIVSVPSVPALSIPYAPLTPPRASPDNLSPPASLHTVTAGNVMADPLPRFSVAFPLPTTPIISLAPPTTGNMFQPAPSSFKPVVHPSMGTAALVGGMVKPTNSTAATVGGLPRPRPLTVITSTTATAPSMAAVVINDNGNSKMSALTSPVSPPSLDYKNTTSILTLETTCSTVTLPKSPTKTPTSSTKTPFRPWADSADMTANV